MPAKEFYVPPNFRDVPNWMDYFADFMVTGSMDFPESEVDLSGGDDELPLADVFSDEYGVTVWPILNNPQYQLTLGEKKAIMLKAMSKRVPEPVFIYDLEEELTELFKADPEIWRVWYDFMGKDAAESELGAKSSDYYVAQGNWVRMMLKHDILPINWENVKRMADDAIGIDLMNIIPELYEKIGQVPPGEEDEEEA